jgi:NhaP-type Na+/H+ and K+/H+ antiporter
MNQIIMLAFPGVAIHTAIVAVVYKYVFPYDWSWKESLLFGSIISATDPVAVVRYLLHLIALLPVCPYHAAEYIIQVCSADCSAKLQPC